MNENAWKEKIDFEVMNSRIQRENKMRKGRIDSEIDYILSRY